MRSVPLRRCVTCGERLGDEGLNHIAIFAMGHHKHSMFAGTAQRLKDVTVRKAQASVVCGEYLKRGNSGIPQAAHFVFYAGVPSREVHVETVIDRALFRLSAPGIHRSDHRRLVERDKIHHGGGAAEGRGLVSGVVVI